MNLWQNLTLTQNLFFTTKPVFPRTVAPFWTLPLEVEMYVALPLLFLIFRNRPARHLAAIWVISVAMAFIQPELGDRWLIIRFVPCFLGGVIAWRLIRGRDRGRLPQWLWPPAIAILSIIWMTATKRYSPLNIGAFGLCLGLRDPPISRDSVERSDNCFENNRALQLWHLPHPFSHYALCNKQPLGTLNLSSSINYLSLDTMPVPCT